MRLQIDCVTGSGGLYLEGLIFGILRYVQPNKSQTKLDDIAHEKTIISRQLFAGHVEGCRAMKRKKYLHRMIMK